MEMKELVQKYVEVRERRRELEKQAQEIKDGEEARLEREILLDFSAKGVKSVHLDGVGRVAIRNRSVLTIDDQNLLARAMVANIVERVQAGAPFSDGLLLQARPSAAAIEDYLERQADKTGLGRDELARAMGIGEIVKATISITK